MDCSFQKVLLCLPSRKPPALVKCPDPLKILTPLTSVHSPSPYPISTFLSTHLRFQELPWPALCISLSLSPSRSVSWPPPSNSISSHLLWGSRMWLEGKHTTLGVGVVPYPWIHCHQPQVPSPASGHWTTWRWSTCSLLTLRTISHVSSSSLPSSSLPSRLLFHPLNSSCSSLSADDLASHPHPAPSGNVRKQDSPFLKNYFPSLLHPRFFLLCVETFPSACETLQSPPGGILKHLWAALALQAPFLCSL